jgi:hypothetical protein
MSWESSRPRRIGVAFRDTTGYVREPARSSYPEEAAASAVEVLGVYDQRDGELYVQYEGVWVGAPFADAEGTEYRGRHLVGVSVISHDCDLEPRIWLAKSRFTDWRIF